MLNELISVLGTRKQYVSYKTEQFLHETSKILSYSKKQQKSNEANNIETHVASLF